MILAYRKDSITITLLLNIPRVAGHISSIRLKSRRRKNQTKRPYRVAKRGSSSRTPSSDSDSSCSDDGNTKETLPRRRALRPRGLSNSRIKREKFLISKLEQLSVAIKNETAAALRRHVRLLKKLEHMKASIENSMDSETLGTEGQEAGISNADSTSGADAVSITPQLT
ncbi:hypothetical protein CC78DRAFT_573155 [Lojkania enalia]|uniref:Uncharacterized protein n=1 Tax=Lojkania enalia TaxID=147567 RepID=A0A9P4TRN1_9PLEO|nr:hypothetical protein CC78DRAFT_573155 [Didymosphaeria enalia]